MLIWSFDSVKRISRVRAPLLFIQGDRDEIIPLRLGQELFAAAPEPKSSGSSKADGITTFSKWRASDTGSGCGRSTKASEFSPVVDSTNPADRKSDCKEFFQGAKV
jgi:hypothetical protein